MDVTPEVRQELTEWLYHEAELLDGRRFEEWLALLADDLTYEMPVRLTREAGGGEEVAREMAFFRDDRETLRLRVARLRTEFAWAEDPPSRTRHFVANVRVRPTDRPDEVEVRSYLLVYRSRGDAPQAELLSGERRDRFRRVGGTWKLCRREFVPDQATLGLRNLALFI